MAYGPTRMIVRMSCCCSPSLRTVKRAAQAFAARRCPTGTAGQPPDRRSDRARWQPVVRADCPATEYTIVTPSGAGHDLRSMGTDWRCCPRAQMQNAARYTADISLGFGRIILLCASCALPEAPARPQRWTARIPDGEPARAQRPRPICRGNSAIHRLAARFYRSHSVI